MGEWELIDFISGLAAERELPWLRVGIGDDAAVLDVPSGESLVVTTDSVVAGVHFEPQTDPELVGYKAVARSVSDLAAMAARPLCTVAAVAFPPAGTQGARERERRLVRALWDAAGRLEAPLIGGDVAGTPGPLSINVTVLGTVLPGRAVTRSGARPGDAVCVTNTLGGSLRGRHLRFTPRVEAARRLVEACEVHALMDISDGLSSDALHIAEAGGHGLVLRWADLPVSEDARRAARTSGHEPAWHALNDGEDYELLFCVPPDQGRRLTEDGLDGLPVTIVGEVVCGPRSELLLPDGTRRELQRLGWEHRV